MNREELKRLWFSLPLSTTIRKEIIVETEYGHVEIRSDGPDGYSHFSTHQELPLEYAKDRMSQDKYKEYKLIVK